MKNEKKNKQGEPAMTQLMGANELSDDVLEAASGGATLGRIWQSNGVILGTLDLNEQEYNWFKKHGDPYNMTIKENPGPGGGATLMSDSYLQMEQLMKIFNDYRFKRKLQ